MLLITFIFSSCANMFTSKNDIDNDTIQLWYYTSYDEISANAIFKVVDRAKEFCSGYNIPLEVYNYGVYVLSHEDYILKRNLAALNGNMIIIEDINSMRDLTKHHADYAKFDNYNKLLNSYKDRFCIPFDILNYLVSEDTYRRINAAHDIGDITYMPVFNTDTMKKTVKVNDNLNFVGKYSGIKAVQEILDSYYKMLFTDGYVSKEIADCHFYNRNYQNYFEQIIISEVKKIINHFHDNGASLDKIDINNEEINKIINKDIDEFVDMFNFYE